MEILGYLPWVLIIFSLGAGVVALARTRVVQKHDPRRFNYLMIMIEVWSDQVGQAHFGSPAENAELLKYARATRKLYFIAAICLCIGAFWLFFIQPTTWAE